MNEEENVFSEGCVAQDADITMGCFAEEEEELPAGGFVRKSIDKAFQGILYNQKLIDNYSCFLVSPFTAISNMTGKRVSEATMKAAFQELKDKGLFLPGAGGYIRDGAAMAAKHFNIEHGTNVKEKLIKLTVDNIQNELRMGSPISTGIKYGPEYFKDEQDNGKIEGGDPFGNKGHAITIVKLNTMDDVIGKFAENYDGVLKFNVIEFDFTKYRKLFFNTGYSFYV